MRDGATVKSEARGAGPEAGTGSAIRIAADSVVVTDGGQIVSRADAGGDGGAIEITAGSVLVSNETDRPEGTFIASIAGRTSKPDRLGEEVQGGALTIRADTVDLIDGGQLFARTEGAGKRGGALDPGRRHRQDDWHRRERRTFGHHVACARECDGKRRSPHRRHPRALRRKRRSGLERHLRRRQRRQPGDPGLARKSPSTEARTASRSSRAPRSSMRRTRSWSATAAIFRSSPARSSSPMAARSARAPAGPATPATS